MVLTLGHYPKCNFGPPCLVVDDYKNKHNFRPEIGGFAAYVLIKKMMVSAGVSWEGKTNIILLTLIDPRLIMKTTFNCWMPIFSQTLS